MKKIVVILTLLATSMPLYAPKELVVQKPGSGIVRVFYQEQEGTTSVHSEYSVSYCINNEWTQLYADAKGGLQQVPLAGDQQQYLNQLRQLCKERGTLMGYK